MAEKQQNQWVVAVFCAIALFFSYGATLNFSLLVEDMRESLELSYGQVSVVVSMAFGLVQLLGPFASAVIDYLGERQSVVIFGFISSLCLLCVAFVDSFALLVLVLGVTYGIAQSITVVACITAPGKLFEESKRQMGVSIPLFGVALSFMVLPLLFHVLNSSYSWRGTLFIFSAMTLHVVPAGLLLDGNVAKTVSWKERVALGGWNDWKMLLFMLASFLYQYADTGVATFYYSILVSQYSLPKQKASLVLTVYGICQMIGRISASFSKPWRFFPRWIQWASATALSFMAIILMGVCTSFASAIALMSLYGLMLGLLIPLRVVAICDLYSAGQLTKIYGYSSFALGLGGLLGPATVGVLIDRSGGYQLPFVLMGLLGLVPFAAAVLSYLAYSIATLRRMPVSKKEMTDVMQSTDESKIMELVHSHDA